MEIPDSSKPRILYVDDTETNLILFEHSFKDEFEIFLADSGQKGLELLRAHKFVAIITDQRMPGMSGNELLEIATAEFPEVMRFLLTAYSDYETLVEAINKGQIYGFFNKPFKANEVKMVLKRAVEVYHLREKNKQMIIELEIANNELKAIDHSKTRFLSTITEEIKSPITKITSAIHMLKDKIDSKDLMELLNYLDSSIIRLGNFSSMANQLAVLREGGKNIRFIDISLKEVLEVCLIENNQEIKENRVKVTVKERAAELMIKGDFDLLLSCLSIILLNAAKHSASDSEIIIEPYKDETGTHLILSLTGENYTKTEIDDMRKLFSPGLKNPESDAGLELVLAKQIMDAHKGLVSIKKSDDQALEIKLSFEIEV